MTGNALLGRAEQVGGVQPLVDRDMAALVQRAYGDSERLAASVALVHAGAMRFALNERRLIDDADRPAKWYFALKSNLIESRRTGETLPHPMNGPVTLHWRS